MLARITIRLAQLPLQLTICTAFSLLTGAVIYFNEWSKVDLSTLDRSTFITALSAIATLIALFCSLSIAWILFISQQAKGERLTTYDLFKSRLLEVRQWLVNLPESPSRNTCLALAYELDMLELSDLPLVERGKEYLDFCEEIEDGLNSSNIERRNFFMNAVTHFAYIDSLLNRIGIISIRQVLMRLFIETLAKGVVLVGFSVLILIASLLWYNPLLKIVFVIASSFIAVGASLLLFEVWVDLRRHYDDELDFVGSSTEEDQAHL
ncbi:hypothetical protein [Pseudomonas sp. 58(2021)]|uniref:hypothetical protein n=1 Tax=Pseudomonas sp. 58(2021) TaxID=2813330 RepID=UPI001A9EF0D4|nr:hypothetical protein [Pseudomonas sp. 58(2021)]